MFTIEHSNLIHRSGSDCIYYMLTERERTRYKIPKHIVQDFDGHHQVSLNVQKAELERFKGDEGFREVKQSVA